ncbi:MAG: BLUF domain-containing protein [Thiotrichales bacterium]
MNKCRLIYKSVASEPQLSNAALQALMQSSVASNRELRINGILLLSGTRFLQVLEGPEKAVNRLFNRIVRDARHHSVRLISYEPIGPAYFDEWHMRLVDLYDLPLPERECFTRKYAHEDGMLLIPETLHLVYALLLDARAFCLTQSRAEQLAGQSPD